MSLTKAFKAWFRSKNEVEEVAQAKETKTVDNLKVGNLVEFGAVFEPELSCQSVAVSGQRVFKLQSGQTLKYAVLDNGIMVRSLDGSKIEIVKELDTETFLNIIDEECHAVMTIDDDEIYMENGKCKLSSNEKNFSITESVGEWLPEGTYYASNHEMECFSKVDGGESKECVFFRGKSLSGKNYIMFVVYEGGEIEVLMSSVLPKYEIENVI